MQSRSKFVRILLVALIVSLVLSSCGGGSTGSTWFNLPSLPVRIQPNGTAKIFGLPINAALLQPALLQQLQAANVQKLDVRWSYNGLHVYANGEDMPYLAWDEASVKTLQDVITKIPNLSNAGMIARALPWLRTIGGGLALHLPLAQGATKLSIPSWSGETSVTAAPAGDKPTIGPLDISSVTFDPAGNVFVGSTPLSSLGVNFSLPPNILDLLKSLGAEKLVIETKPDGLKLALNDQALPSLAYDAAYLDRAQKLVNQVVTDQNLLGTLNDVLPLLPGAQVKAAVSFTGQPAGETSLSNLNVAINPDGSLRVLGIPVGSASVVPANILSSLQASNVQQLDLAVGGTGLTISSNGQALPQIGWSPESLKTLAGVIAPLAGVSQDQVNSGLSLITGTGLDLSVAVPPAAGVQPVEVAAGTEPSYAPVDLGEFAAPVIRATLGVQGDAITSIGPIQLGDLSAVGLPGSIALPANVMGILKQLGAKEVELTTTAGGADLMLDGKSALTLKYDEASLRALLQTVKPFLGGTLLDDPNIAKLIDEQILKLAPGAEVDVKLQLK